MGLPHDSSLNFAKAGWRTLTFLSVVLLWTGCATRPDHASSAAGPGTSTGRYVRVVHETNGVLALEIAARQFRSPDRRKPALWLVGAVHVADPEYYDRLQELLDRMTLVLFEGVRSRDAGQAREPEHAGGGSAGSLQASLAEALGISFQLDRINYSRAHFLNSDLSVAELTQWLSQESRETGGSTGEAKEPSGKAELDLLMSAMDGDSWVSTVAKWGLGLIASSPKLRTTTLAVLIETAGAYADSMEDMAGLTPGMRRLLDVLLSARNAKVMADLKQAVGQAKPKDSIAVFYGAAHMADLETRFRKELGFHQHSTVWLRGIEINVREAGLTSEELTWIRSLVRPKPPEL